MNKLLAKVAELIQKSTVEGQLEQAVIGVFADKELTRRRDLLVKGYDALLVAEKGLESIDKPDFVLDVVTEAGPTSPTKGYTPKRKQEIDAAKKKLSKIEEALTQAWTGQFTALEKLLQGGGKEEPKTDDGVKKSARGLLRVESEGGHFVLYDRQTREQEQSGLLETVFEDGKMTRFYTLRDIRERLANV